MAYTARQCYDALLVELSKEGAPSILLSDFNYFINKAIYQYVNKQYNIYDINLQTTDDLRVLQSSASISAENGCIFLPDDYFHLLNCVCEFTIDKEGKCDDGKIIKSPAKRLTGDSWSAVMNDYYNRPTPKRPYYYIVNNSELIGEPYVNGNICEIRYGDDSSYHLNCVYIDYLKLPQIIDLTLNQLNKISDTSLVLEFPDYICLQIINELVQIVMMTITDPRLLTHRIITQSIASPIQRLTNTPKILEETT